MDDSIFSGSSNFSMRGYLSLNRKCLGLAVHVKEKLSFA